MSTISAKIAEIEAEIARTQKNKATEGHLGILRARIAQLKRDQLVETMKSKSGGGGGFDVRRTGNCSVGLIGFPSVGKSSLINKVCDNVNSDVSDIEFTTLTAISGIMELHGARVQLIDLPGIVEGAASGRGGGRQVIAAARASDLLMIILDASKPLTHKQLILNELESAGIRVNRNRRNIIITRNEKGASTVQILKDCPSLDESTILAVLKDMKAISVNVRIMDEGCIIDDIIDAVLEFQGSPRLYLPAIFVANKCDSLTQEEFRLITELPNIFPVSVTQEWGINELKEAMWHRMAFVRVYTKAKSDMMPDLAEPVMLTRARSSVRDLCLSIHSSFIENFAYALVWGKSSKFTTAAGGGPQRVGIDHVLEDEDVICLFTKN